MMDKNDLFIELDYHLMKDKYPSEYLKKISNLDIFKHHPFDMLGRLQETEQQLEHHPEGSVWNHTLLVVDVAASEKTKSKNARAFMWAALLHDIGKPSTTKIRKGRITSYNHEKVGASLAKEFLLNFIKNEDFIDTVYYLILYHMQILFVVKNLPFADIKGMKQNTSVDEIALFGFCDRLGRGNADREKEENNIRIFLEKCKKI